MGSDSITKLAELTKKLPVWPTSTRLTPIVTKYNVECGTVLSIPLLSEPGVSVVQWFASTGANFSTHIHQQKEWLIVYLGEMKLYIEGKDPIIIHEGESAFIEPGVPHGAEWLTDTWMVSVSVPHCDDWPDKIS